MKKKIISIMLTLCVVVAMFPMVAWGGESKFDNGILYLEDTDISDTIGETYSWNAAKKELKVNGSIDAEWVYLPDNSVNKDTTTIIFSGNSSIRNLQNNNGAKINLEIKASGDNDATLEIGNVNTAGGDIVTIAAGANVKTNSMSIGGLEGGELYVNGTLEVTNEYGTAITVGKCKIDSTGKLKASGGTAGIALVGSVTDMSNTLEIVSGGELEASAEEKAAVYIYDNSGPNLGSGEKPTIKVNDILRITDNPGQYLGGTYKVIFDTKWNDYYWEGFGGIVLTSEYSDELEEIAYAKYVKLFPAPSGNGDDGPEIIPPNNDGTSPGGHHHTTKYTVKFDSNGGSEVADKVLTSITGKVIEDVTAPLYDGKEFAGWTYGDIAVTEDSSFFDLTKNFSTFTITLTAQWNEIEEVLPPDDIDDIDEEEPADKADTKLDKTSEDEGNADTPKTGDANEMTLWLMLFLTSGVGVTALYRRTKARR